MKYVLAFIAAISICALLASLKAIDTGRSKAPSASIVAPVALA